MKEEKRLNTRQWALYKMLKDNLDHFISLRQIYLKLNKFYPNLKMGIAWNNQPARRIITEDINRLKQNDTIQTVILSTNKGIKIANEEEYKNYLDKEKIAILKRLKIYYKQRFKAGLNNQQRLVFNQEKAIFESLINNNNLKEVA